MIKNWLKKEQKKLIIIKNKTKQKNKTIQKLKKRERERKQWSYESNFKGEKEPG